MSKVAKQFRKQAVKAERFAAIRSVHSEGLSDLAAAFRAQAEILKKNKKKKRKAAEAEYPGIR
jgi:hypothetical protein